RASQTSKLRLVPTGFVGGSLRGMGMAISTSTAVAGGHNDTPRWHAHNLCSAESHSLDAGVGRVTNRSSTSRDPITWPAPTSREMRSNADSWISVARWRVALEATASLTTQGV